MATESKENKRKEEGEAGMEGIGWAVLTFFIFVVVIAFAPIVTFSAEEPQQSADNQQDRVISHRSFVGGEDEDLLRVPPPPSLLGDDIDEESVPSDPDQVNKDRIEPLSI